MAQAGSAADIVECCGKFLRTYSGRAEFTDDDSRCGVGKYGGICERRARRNSKCQHAQNGIARSGDVKDLSASRASFDAGPAHARIGNFKARRRNVDMPRWRFLRNAQAFFPKRDDDGAATEMRQQRAPCFFS